MDRETCTIMAELMLKVPPKSETPEEQKFHIGEIVRIGNANSWFAKRYTLDQLFEIEYSYTQKHGGSSGKKQYSLKHLFEDNSSAWFDESELELVKGIAEITEEREFKEYERLKQKFNVA